MYLLAASKDQDVFRLTLKMRTESGGREPVLEKHVISDAVAQQAILTY